MKPRILYGTIAVSALVATFALDALLARAASGTDGLVARLVRHGSLIPLLFMVIAVGAALELTHLLEAGGTSTHARFSAAMVAAMMAVPWLSAAGWIGYGPFVTDAFAIQAVVMILAMIAAGVLTIVRGRTRGASRDVAGTLLVVAYVGLLGSFALHIRCAPATAPTQGPVLLLGTLLVIKASDIGAYFVGSAFGRRKLAPTISPGKTVAGAVGGLAFGAGSAIFLYGVAQSTAATAMPGHGSVHDIEAVATNLFASPGTSWKTLLIVAAFGLTLSVAGQFGDLLESCFKRDAGAKDSGGILPQFGGILDLVDSPILALPVGWLWLTWLGVIA